MDGRSIISPCTARFCAEGSQECLLTHHLPIKMEVSSLLPRASSSTTRALPSVRFKPFIGATKATVVDANGKSMEVDAIMGADELYDMAKFRVIGNTNAAPIASKASEAGNKVWLVPYSIKKPQYQQEDISSVEQFNTSYNYYIFSNTVPRECHRLPICQ